MAEEQEFSLLGGSMLSEEQFHKMMDAEHAAMQQEAALRQNVPTSQQDMRDMGRAFETGNMEGQRDQNEGIGRNPTTKDPVEVPPPAPGNKTAQLLRFLPRGSVPSELPQVPSPPLVPEVTPKLPTPAPRGPFAPPPEGPAPETPFRRLPTPPRPNKLEASNSPFLAADEAALPPNARPTSADIPPEISKADEERYSPEIAYQYLKQNMKLDQTNQQMAAANREPVEPWKQFASDAVSTAMSVLPPGGPRAPTPFGRAGVRFGPPEAPSRPVTLDAAGRPIGEGSLPREPSNYDSSTQKPGQPPIPKRMPAGQGRTTNEQSAANDAEMAKRTVTPSRSEPQSQTSDEPYTVTQSSNYTRSGWRQYNPETGEYGPADSAMRSVKRSDKLPQEEADLGKNVNQFPEGYFDRVPRQRRTSGAGISHPGYRWEIRDLETGRVVTEQMNKTKANKRADILRTNYGAQRYDVAPVPAKTLTSPEKSYLDKYEIRPPSRETTE